MNTNQQIVPIMDGVSRIRPTLRTISLLKNQRMKNNNREVITDNINGGYEVKGVAKKTITVKVHRQGMEPILFMLEMSTPMVKLMDAFSKEANIGLDGLRFSIDGARIQNHDTPNSLELEEEDLIEVFQYQLGGIAALQVE